MSEKDTTTPEPQPLSVLDTMRAMGKAALASFVAVNALAVPIIMYKHEIASPVKAAGALMEAYMSLFYDTTGLDSCTVDEFEEMRQKLTKGSSASGMSEKLRKAQQEGAKFVSPDDLAATEERLTEASGMQVKIDIVCDYSERNFGFKTVITKEDLAQMDTQVLDTSLAAFVGYSSLLPTNLMKKADIDTLTVKAHRESGSDGLEIGGEYSTMTDEVWVSAQDLSTPAVFVHEVVGHGIHDTACHGVGRYDQSFPQLNPAGYEYTDSAAKAYSTKNNPTTHVDRYSQVNVREDVAMTTQTYLTGGMAFDKTSIDTPVARKTALILHRIDEIQPGAADALIAVQAELTYLQQNPGEQTIAGDMLPKTR